MQVASDYTAQVLFGSLPCNALISPPQARVMG